jgi:hypothetical protein
VAKTQTGSKPLGLTRGKAVLIAVLSVVLVGVLYMQYGKFVGGAAEEASERVASRTPARKPALVTQVKPAGPNAETEDDTQNALLEFDQAKWTPPEVSKVIAYDPFALPDGFPRPSTSGLLGPMAEETEATAEEKSKQLADALAELQIQLDELKERGVHVIIGQNDQYVATIGDRVIHVGDEIGNGFTVTEIDPKEGVRVEWKHRE